MRAHTLFAGTSGWAYPTWRPGFYPAGLAPKKFLAHYASRLNTVEVNFTFRRNPSAKQLSDWLSQAGENFCFSFKAPQTVTHILRLRDCDAPFAEFLRTLEQVPQQNRGALLLQFPPNLRPASSGKDKKRNADALAHFLQCNAAVAAQAGWRLAAEFRDAGWFAEETYALLRGHNVALCFASSDELATPPVRTADFAYSRLRASGYTPAELDAAISEQLALAQLGKTFAYFKHEDAPDGPLRAEKLLQAAR